MAVEYGWRGLVGTLTPQANTTVEPELAILLPPGVASLTARMVSAAPDMEGRLVEYFDNVASSAAQFATAPVDVIVMACTGASYLVGPARERELVAAASSRVGKPLVTSGLAVVAALQALGARRVAFVSPYSRALTDASVAYWAAFGIEAARVIEVGAVAGAFHPVYAMESGSVLSALDALDGVDGLEAVVLLGTGMPTLGPILDKPRAGGAPVLSCMLATAWRAMLEIDGAAPTRESVLAWIDAPEWAGRLRARQIVTRGLDPRVHGADARRVVGVDHRVKPGGDGVLI